MAEVSAPQQRADFKEEKEKEKDVRTSNIVAAKGINHHYLLLIYCMCLITHTHFKLWQIVFAPVLDPR